MEKWQEKVNKLNQTFNFKKISNFEASELSLVYNNLGLNSAVHSGNISVWGLQRDFNLGVVLCSVESAQCYFAYLEIYFL